MKPVAQRNTKSAGISRLAEIILGAERWRDVDRFALIPIIRSSKAKRLIHIISAAEPAADVFRHPRGGQGLEWVPRWLGQRGAHDLEPRNRLADDGGGERRRPFAVFRIGPRR